MPKDFLRKSWWINFAIIFCFLLLLPVISPSFRVPLYGKYLSFAFVALGIVLSWGYCGILSLGQGIFFGIGAYSLAMFLKLEASSPELPDFMVWSSVEQLPLAWEPFLDHLVPEITGYRVDPEAVAKLVVRRLERLVAGDPNPVGNAWITPEVVRGASVGRV